MADPQLLWVETFRDWVIIIMGIAVAAFFFISLVLTIVIGLLIRAALRRGIGVLDDNVKPLLDTAQETASNVKGTAAYVSDAAVQPIIRTYGVVAGVRRAAAVLAGLAGTSDEKTND